MKQSRDRVSVPGMSCVDSTFEAVKVFGKVQGRQFGLKLSYGAMYSTKFGDRLRREIARGRHLE